MIEDHGTRNLADRLIVAEANLERAEMRIKMLKAALVVAAELLEGKDSYSLDEIMKLLKGEDEV
ncbi:MAG: hypothetical protein COA88_14590 [Kordia sp.]|nr:MAG: hypothetical protein COA88_14590 [Kordia sp.]